MLRPLIAAGLYELKALPPGFAETGVPGDNYDVAPGCGLLRWLDEVDAAIAFRRFS